MIQRTTSNQKTLKKSKTSNKEILGRRLIKLQRYFCTIGDGMILN